jgi:hypothetical protein
MAGFLIQQETDCYGVGAAEVVDGDAKVVTAERSPLWFETVMATPAMTAAAAMPTSKVPVPISSAGFTPAGLPGAKAPSAAKAALPTIVATVTAATTLLKPNIGFPRLSNGRYLSEAASQVNRYPNSFFDRCQKALPQCRMRFERHFAHAENSAPNVSGPIAALAIAKALAFLVYLIAATAK